MPFQIVRNDITKMHVDAIVNTANHMHGYGAGIDSAVYGKQILIVITRSAVRRTEGGQNNDWSNYWRYCRKSL